jgi:hypothetical protein
MSCNATNNTKDFRGVALSNLEIGVVAIDSSDS